MTRLQKELIIFFAILLILAFIQHPDLLNRFSRLPDAVVYGMGAFHPLAFALIGYVVIGIFRLIAAGIQKIFRKKN